MTIAEFQAWLDGYSASFGDAPNAEQWAKIKEKIADLAIVRLPDVRGPMLPWIDVPYSLPRNAGCNCPAGTVCMNVACPGRSVVTC